MAVRSRSAIRSVSPARGSSCTCSIRSSATKADGGSHRSASAAARAARCWLNVPDSRAATMSALQHWKLERDADGLGWLTLDKHGATMNTLSAAVLAELRTVLAELAGEPPKGLVIRSGKENGFIAGADIDEFGELKTVDDAVALVRRGWDAFEQLATAPYPTLALVRGFCLGGGMELALACVYRIVVDEPGTRLGLPEVMLGIVPGWGGIKRLPRLIGAPAALDLLLTGKTVDARRARKLGIADECVPLRIMDNTARGVLRERPAPRRVPFPLSLTLKPPIRPLRAAKARKQGAARARREPYPSPYAILDIWVKIRRRRAGR